MDLSTLRNRAKQPNKIGCQGLASETPLRSAVVAQSLQQEDCQATSSKDPLTSPNRGLSAKQVLSTRIVWAITSLRQ